MEEDADGYSIYESPITYVQLNENGKGDLKKVLEAAKQGDTDTFTIIRSHENHHAIIDEHSECFTQHYNGSIT